MNYAYISQPLPPQSLTKDEQLTVIIIFAVLFIFIAVVWSWVFFDVPNELSSKSYRRQQAEQKILKAIADNSGMSSAEYIHPGLTIAEIVVATSLPLNDVVNIVRRLKRDEVVREGKNENAVKTYYV